MMVAGSAFFVLTAAFVKAASDEANPLQSALFRSAVALVILLVAMRATATPILSPRWRLLLVRGVVGSLALSVYLWAVARGALADVMALQQLAPIFVTLLSVLWLRERPRALHYALAGLCLLGALCVMRPSRGLVSFGAMLAVGSAALSSVAYVSVRTLTRTEPTVRIVFWFSAVATALTLPPALIYWHPLSLRAVALLLAGGVSATAGQTLMTASYRRAQAHVASAFAYATVPLGFLIGVLVWGERPDALSGAGITVIVVAGVTIALTARSSTEPTEATPPHAP